MRHVQMYVATRTSVQLVVNYRFSLDLSHGEYSYILCSSQFIRACSMLDFFAVGS